MGIFEVGFKGRKRAVSKIDQQSIAQMKEIIAAQNKKRTLVVTVRRQCPLYCFSVQGL